jgi:hypothetical protein
MNQTMKKQLTTEQGMYIIATLLALTLRLLNLGAIPLSEFEADWALQARGLVEGQPVNIGSQPLIVMLMSAVFTLFGTSEFAVRLFPALFGTALVWLPYFFRLRLGRKAALVLAFGLALDPGLLSLSRLGGGPVLAVSTGLLCLIAWIYGSPMLAGVLGALALLSSPAILPGVLGLAVAWGLTGGYENGGKPLFPRDDVRRAALAGFATLLLAGTFFMRFPQGISGLGSVFTDYLGGWANSSGVPVSHLFAALLVYQPAGLIFGIAAALRAWIKRIPVGRALSVWALVAR